MNFHSKEELRRAAEQAVENLIALLDEIDGECDLEEDDGCEENGDLEEEQGV